MSPRLNAACWMAVALLGCQADPASMDPMATDDPTTTGDDPTTDDPTTGDDPTTTDDEPTSAGTDDEIRRLIDEAVAEGFSGTILLTVDGETAVLEGHDFANRDLEVLNGADTAFDFGSVMKDFTAAAIFKLQDDGMLSVSDPLSAVLPEVPADKAEITVLDIVQHRAGFDEYHDTQGDFEPLTRLEARGRILAQPLLFDPGSDESYSNSGYTLLADIIQTVSDREFTDYIREELFISAQMTHSGFFGDPIWEPGQTAVGYESSMFEDNDPATWPYTWALMGNGGLVTTVGDLQGWLRGLWAGEILSPAAFDAYHTDYLSLSVSSFEGLQVYGAAGAGDFGLGGVVIHVPELDLRVIIGTNTYDRFDIETFAIDLGIAALTAP